MSHEPPAGGPPDWYTPPEFFARLPLVFDLDPCAPPLPRASWIPVRRRISLPADGLTVTWHDDEFVWLNPPYDERIGAWLAKLAEHPAGGVALLNNRSETAWWQRASMRATVTCFPAQRVKFVDGNRPYGRRERSRATHGQVLFGFGDRAAEGLRASDLGVCQQHVESRTDLALWTAA